MLTLYLQIQAQPLDDNTIKEKKMQVFVDYLEELAPLVGMGIKAFTKSKIKHLKQVAGRPDFLMPFRQKAPTMMRAMETIYKDPDNLLTPAGIINTLCFRGVFYGATFAKEELRWFNNLEEWTKFYNEHKLSGDAKKTYFVNKSAYGNPSDKRTVDLVPQYWKEYGRIQMFLKQHTDNNGKIHIEAKKMYDFMLTMYNIGPLSALLAVGDLIEATALAIPTSQVWGNLVAELSKGALAGLQNLGLIPAHYGINANNKSRALTVDERAHVTNAFVELHDYVEAKMHKTYKDLVGYSIITLEHGLCKRNRILLKSEKLVHRQSKPIKRKGKEKA
ncbi:hypothetical protein GALMADRAFT_81690 [Galerina marginata CBS 339.88]|uniref:5-hmdU DNA kinase helical domain-containing protein n=1 Tax=Galerina marginata (strain CBS 339.88) TaxID=685588 RepID=A0A067S6S8_GALM3|nr:hypothetical protein GALMADRAFT_81690 [Galerina marginata CBS 339.88]